jgi:hypothetical protein
MCLPFACIKLGRFRRIAVCYFAFALLSTVAAAQNEAAEAPAPSTTSHELSGVVLNSVTGEPVRRALVQVSGALGMQWSALTDSEGRFEFTSMPDSDVNVTARKPGFFNDAEVHSQSFHPEITHVGAEPLVVKLLPESIVFGHVTTQKGEPIEDSPVRVLRQTIVDGRRIWAMQGQVMTDEDGSFRIANLVPGKYVLSAGPSVPPVRAFGRGHAERQEGFSTMYYPGVPELDSATPLVISGGQQLQADFALKAEPLYKVSGQVLGMTPGMGAGLQFLTKGGEPLPLSVSLKMQSGKFDAAVPGGSYVLQLRGADGNGNVAAADLPLIVNGDVDGVSMVLTSPITLPVRIDPRPSGTNRENALASAAVGHIQFISSVRLTSTDDRQDVAQFQAEMNDKGSLVFRNLVAGHYAVEVSALAPWYVRSITSGSTDLMREDLVVASGRRPEPLEIVLRDDSCSLHGLIRVDGQPAAGAVLLLPDQGSLAYVQTSITGAGSEFYFAGLAPGDYKLLAVDSIEDLEFRNPEALAPYLSKAVSISLSANEASTVNVERVSTGKQP